MFKKNLPGIASLLHILFNQGLLETYSTSIARLNTSKANLRGAKVVGLTNLLISTCGDIHTGLVDLSSPIEMPRHGRLPPGSTVMCEFTRKFHQT